MNEQELLRRIEADEKGKRDAGLAAWQCRRCSKRPRVDPPAAAPVRILETSRAPQATPTQRDGIVDAARATVISSAVPTASLDTSRNSDNQATRSRLPATPAVIEIDDDIEMVDMSSLVIVPPPTPVPAQAPVKPPSQTNPREAPAPSTSAAPAAGGFPSKRAPNVTSDRQTHILGKAAGSARGRQVKSLTSVSPEFYIDAYDRQKRPAKNALVITPLVPSQRPVDEVRPSSPPRVHVTGGLPVRPLPPPSRDAHSSAAPKRPITFPVPPVIPTPPAPSVSAQDLRDLISNMRANGQLQPPPTVDYVLSRPQSARKTTIRAPSPPRRDIPEMRSQSRDLEEVERKLSDSGDDRMDVDSLPPEPVPVPIPEPDPHNIDDLYGDIAPRFRSARPPSARPKSVPPTPQNRLLFALQKKRVSSDNGASTAAAQTGDARADVSMKPRKVPARQLKGKALHRKQAAGLVFNVSDSKWLE